MREFLKGLELDGETIDAIMAEYGKNVSKDKEEVQKYKDEASKYKEEMQGFKSKVSELEKNSTSVAEIQEKYDKLVKDIEAKAAKTKAEEEDKILTDNINALFDGKEFTSEYAKIGLTNDIKAGLAKEENKGKGIKDIFEELTKDDTTIFKNPNEFKDMPPIGDIGKKDDKIPTGEIKLNSMFKNYN